MVVHKISAVGAAHKVITHPVHDGAAAIGNSARVTAQEVLEEPAVNEASASGVAAENELLESDIFPNIDCSNVTDSEMDDAQVPLRVTGETIRCCVDQTYAAGCGIVNHVAVQVATDEGIKATAVPSVAHCIQTHLYTAQDSNCHSCKALFWCNN